MTLFSAPRASLAASPLVRWLKALATAFCSLGGVFIWLDAVGKSSIGTLAISCAVAGLSLAIAAAGFARDYRAGTSAIFAGSVVALSFVATIWVLSGGVPNAA